MIYINGCSWTSSHIFKDELMNADLPVINNAASGYSNFQICKHTIYDLKYFSKCFEKLYAIIFLTEPFRSDYEFKLLKEKKGNLQDLARQSLFQIKTVLDKSLPDNVELIYSSGFVDLPWKTRLPSMLTLACESHKITIEQTKCYTTKADKLIKANLHRPSIQDLDTIIARCKTIEKIPMQRRHHLWDNTSYANIANKIKEITNG